MGFLEEKCYLSVLDEATLASTVGFSCGNPDLDDFFLHESCVYNHQLLGKSYCYRLVESPEQVVSAFTLSNASIRVDGLPNARKKKVERNIPHAKTFKDYPAVLIGRLGVNIEFQSMYVGSELMKFIKYWFIDSHNKTGCRFIVVDSYNNPQTLAFYKSNGFEPVFSGEQQEKEYRRMSDDDVLHTRLLYFDLINISLSV